MILQSIEHDFLFTVRFYFTGCTNKIEWQSIKLCLINLTCMAASPCGIYWRWRWKHNNCSLVPEKDKFAPCRSLTKTIWTKVSFNSSLIVTFLSRVPWTNHINQMWLYQRLVLNFMNIAGKIYKVATVVKCRIHSDEINHLPLLTCD